MTFYCTEFSSIGASFVFICYNLKRTNYLFSMQQIRSLPKMLKCSIYWTTILLIREYKNTSVNTRRLNIKSTIKTCYEVNVILWSTVTLTKKLCAALHFYCNLGKDLFCCSDLLEFSQITKDCYENSILSRSLSVLYLSMSYSCQIARNFFLDHLFFI